MESDAPKSQALKKKERFEQIKLRKKSASYENAQFSQGKDTDSSLDTDSEQGDSGPRYNPERVAEQAQMFGNRIKKRHMHLWKWAKRTGVSCFRIYDRDIPEIPLTVDVYQQHLHIALILKYRNFSDEEMLLWTQAMADAARRALGIQEDRVFLKTRLQQKGHQQYEKVAQLSKILEVKENDLQFEINLSDYLDTGLFLDHRDTRVMVSQFALNCRFLNLFSYTGSFSVYAAAGGAASTLSVDLSNTYSDWASRNLALNGFAGKLHRCESADVMAWLPLAVKEKQQFDLIVIDPPTFSNSKKMAGVFDIQRDHVTIINQSLKLLSKNGAIVFSNNFRKFKLEKEKIDCKWIDDITNKSIPEDFKGKRPHWCWLIRKEGPKY